MVGLLNNSYRQTLVNLLHHDPAKRMLVPGPIHSASMNSKERILTAVHLAQPDRVPLDLLPNRWVAERLHRDLGTRTHRELLERLGCDVVDLRGVVDPVYRGPVPFMRNIGGRGARKPLGLASEGHADSHRAGGLLCRLPPGGRQLGRGFGAASLGRGWTGSTSPTLPNG